MRKLSPLLLLGLLIPALAGVLFVAGVFSRPAPPKTTSTAAPIANLPENSVATIPRLTTAITYPWKTDIITTVFWIGEQPNTASAWDENWRATNGGSDSPTDRNGYATASHAAGVNPFYVALPFNDLAYRDKAAIWVPHSWARLPKNGKPVSACRDRWVEIINAQGIVCYAQWEDVGPVRYDHAEYVFGHEDPGSVAGLNVSPAVAQYLQLGDKPGEKDNLTSWRFVDDKDVPPGQWLKYEEDAVIYAAMHEKDHVASGSGATNPAPVNLPPARSALASQRSKL